MAEKKRKRDDDELTEREEEPAAEAAKPTMGAIFKEVVAKNRKHASALDLFEQNCQSYGWEGDEKYFETTRWGGPRTARRTAPRRSGATSATSSATSCRASAARRRSRR